MIKDFLSPQFRVFLLTGGTAAAVNIGSRILYSHWCSLSVAVTLAYLSGMVTAFVLARLFVFKQSTQSMGRSIVMFSLVNGVAYLQTLGLTVLFAEYLFPAWHFVWRAEFVAHTIGVVAPVFTSYIGHKRFSFK